jgi:hypothetical protein
MLDWEAIRDFREFMGQRRQESGQAHFTAHLRGMPKGSTKRSLIGLCAARRGAGNPNRKAAGRGAYVHNQRSCWETALKGSLLMLKTELTEADRAA